MSCVLLAFQAQSLRLEALTPKAELDYIRSVQLLA